MNILLVGGGSGGPVAPLLAVAEELKIHHPKVKFLLVGTKTGPESLMAKQAGIAFQSVPAGKFRRYFSLYNLVAPFLVVGGFFKTLSIIREFRPSVVFGAGSFVQVPVIWAAWLLRVPVVIHQQDVVPSLANILCQFQAKKITVSLESSLTDFSSAFGVFYKKHIDKVVFTGNPFREDLKKANRQQAIEFFKLKHDLPVLFVTGGGTGSEFLNRLTINSLPLLTKTVQIVHQTGQGKFIDARFENYYPYEFLSNMAYAYAAADIVLCRAGLSTITELSNLEKLSIIVPMPNSHQKDNGLYLSRNKAALVIGEDKLNSDNLTTLVRRLLFEPQIQKEIKENIGKIMPRHAAAKIADLIAKVSETN